LDQADDCGIPSKTILAGTGMSSDQLRNDLLEVTAHQELKVFGNLLAQVGDPVRLGVMLGQRYHLTVYGIWGYSLLCRDTFGDAVARALRYLRLTYAFTDISQQRTNGAITLRFGAPNVEANLRDALVTRDMAASLMIARELVGAEFVVKRLALSLRDAPSYAANEAATSYFGVRPMIDGNLNEYSFDDVWIKKRLPLANSVTAAYCDRICSNLQAEDAKPSVARQVNQVIKSHHFRSTSLDEVSAIIGLTSRTLKRRLAAEGTSFKEILAAVRHESAKSLLKNDHLAISEIASRLGYSDASSFSQAFKRQEKVSPLHFRHQVPCNGI
jgi:AraC-like DNA-binding protein